MKTSQKHRLAKISTDTAPLYSMKGICLISYQDLGLVGLDDEVQKWRGGGLERLKEGGGGGRYEGESKIEEGEKGEERTTERQDVRK